VLRHVGKFVCKRADGIRVESKRGEKWCEGALGIPSKRVFLDHIAMSMLEPNQYPAPGLETKANRILYVGRLASEKDISTLLEAFEELHENRPNAELVIVGDGPKRDDLEALAVELGIASTVTFEGAVPYENLPAYYDEAAVVVLPSLRETFGRVILEAFAFGTPVVATDARGPSELVEPGEIASSFRSVHYQHWQMHLRISSRTQASVNE
jgi:glycosyltransferase involved in cell wall biosynthesis